MRKTREPIKEWDWLGSDSTQRIQTLSKADTTSASFWQPVSNHKWEGKGVQIESSNSASDEKIEKGEQAAKESVSSFTVLEMPKKLSKIQINISA